MRIIKASDTCFALLHAGKFIADASGGEVRRFASEADAERWADGHIDDQLFDSPNGLSPPLVYSPHTALEVVTTNGTATDWLAPVQRVRYTNHRKETAERALALQNPWYGVSLFHLEDGPQWFLRAWDLDKEVQRDFALKDLVPLGPLHHPGA